LIDLHCHILPNVDDGAESLAVSIAMARVAVDDGIETIVATPHTLNETYTNLPGQVADRVAELRDIFSREQIGLTLLPGADVHLNTGMAERVFAGEAATINGNGKYMLVEFPSMSLPDGYQEELFELKLKGITPIITHPERNLVFQHNPDALYDLVGAGCLIQATAMSITGGFGQEAMECVHRLLERRLVHVIATDAHSATRRPPVLSTAVAVAAQILGSREAAVAMVKDLPEAIIRGEAVTIAEPVRPGKKKWWQFF
jgi:protein-tyrosine phosphatase